MVNFSPLMRFAFYQNFTALACRPEIPFLQVALETPVDVSGLVVANQAAVVTAHKHASASISTTPL